MTGKTVDRAEWRKWYAWRPVKVYEKTGLQNYHWAWLCWLERRRVFGFEGISLMARKIYREPGSDYQGSNESFLKGEVK